MSSARRPGTGWIAGLVLLTALALGLRLVGIDYGAPLWEEGDAYFPGHVELLRKGVEVSKRTDDNVQYPSLVPKCVALIPERAVPPAGSSRAAHLRAARGTFVQTRAFVALIGLLTIPLVFCLARRLVADGWALFAAAIPAVSLLHVGFSQQARPHAVLGTLFLASLMACMRLRARPTAGNYLLAGGLAALSVGCLHSGAMMVLSGFVAHLQAERPPERRGWRGALLEPRLLLALAPIAAAVPFFYAYAFDSSVRESKQIFRIENGSVYMSTHKLSLEMWNGSGALSLLRILRDWEPELLVLLPLGVFGWLLARKRPDGLATDARAPSRSGLAAGDGWVLASFLVPYLLLLTAYARTYERFLIPLLPFAAVFAAYGAERIAARLGPGARRVFAGALVLLLALPAWASAHFVWVRSQPGTYERAGAWVEAYLDPDGSGVPAPERILLTPPFDLPLARGDEAFRDEAGKRRTQLFSVWSRYLNRLDEVERPGPLYDLRWLLATRKDGDLTDPAALAAYLDRQGPGLYVIEVAKGARAHQFLRHLAEGLAQRGELLERFSPDPDPYFSDHPLADEDEEVEDWPGFFWRSLAARSVGPVVEVYRVP